MNQLKSIFEKESIETRNKKVEKAICQYIESVFYYYDLRCDSLSNKYIFNICQQEILFCCRIITYLTSLLETDSLYKMKFSTFNVLVYGSEMLKLSLIGQEEMLIIRSWWHFNWKNILVAILFGIKIPAPVTVTFQEAYKYLQGKESDSIRTMQILFANQ